VPRGLSDVGEHEEKGSAVRMTFGTERPESITLVKIPAETAIEDLAKHLPKNTVVERTAPCPFKLYERVFEPKDASVVLISGEGGTGKTFEAVNIMYDLATKLHFYVLTNIIFLQKTNSGFRQVMNPHERVRHITSMRQLWYEYALICKEYQVAHPRELGGPIIVLMLDEWTKYMKRLAIYDKVVLATISWWGENRKFQTVPTMITQKMGNAPRQLLPYIKWYLQKSQSLTRQYNSAKGSSYHYKELSFLIRILLEDELERRKETEFTLEDVVCVMQDKRGPWTGSIDRAKVGQICYDSRASANFMMGVVNGSEDWFDDFLRYISSCPAMFVPDKILEFFESTPDRSLELSDTELADLAVDRLEQLEREMPPGTPGPPILMHGMGKGKDRIPVPFTSAYMELNYGCSHIALFRALARKKARDSARKP